MCQKTGLNQVSLCGLICLLDKCSHRQCFQVLRSPDVRRGCDPPRSLKKPLPSSPAHTLAGGTETAPLTQADSPSI